MVYHEENFVNTIQKMVSKLKWCQEWVEQTFKPHRMTDLRIVKKLTTFLYNHNICWRPPKMCCLGSWTPLSLILKFKVFVKIFWRASHSQFCLPFLEPKPSSISSSSTQFRHRNTFMILSVKSSLHEGLNHCSYFA